MQTGDKVQVSILISREKSKELTHLLSRASAEVMVSIISFDDAPKEELIIKTYQEDWSVSK